MRIHARLTMVAALAVLGCVASTPFASEDISLAGQWRFRRDDQNVGVDQRWYAGPLAAAADGPATIRLPGTTDEAKAGLPNPKKPTLDGLYRPNVYTGAAWYQRDVEIPAAWRGKHVIAAVGTRSLGIAGMARRPADRRSAGQPHRAARL